MKALSKIVSIVSVGALALVSSPRAASAQEQLPPPEASPPPPAAEAPPAAAVPLAPPRLVVVTPERRTLEPDADAPRVEGPPRYDFIRVGAGFRIAYVNGDGFDRYADSDVLTSFAVDATITLLRRNKLTLAAGLGWDVGGRSDGFRGADSSLTAHRFTVPIEGRYHYKPWLYSFAKLAPGAAFLRAKVDDRSSPTITDTAWAFAGDLSVGASVLVTPHGNADKRHVRLWATPEIGYSLMTSANVRPNPGRDENDVLGTDVSTNLGSVGLSGLFWRLSFAATF